MAGPEGQPLGAGKAQPIGRPGWRLEADRGVVEHLHGLDLDQLGRDVAGGAQRLAAIAVADRAERVDGVAAHRRRAGQRRAAEGDVHLAVARHRLRARELQVGHQLGIHRRHTLARQELAHRRHGQRQDDGRHHHHHHHLDDGHAARRAQQRCRGGVHQRPSSAWRRRVDGAAAIDRAVEDVAAGQAQHQLLAGVVRGLQRAGLGRGGDGVAGGADVAERQRVVAVGGGGGDAQAVGRRGAEHIVVGITAAVGAPALLRLLHLRQRGHRIGAPALAHRIQERGQRHGSQHADHGHHHHQFDEGEAGRHAGLSMTRLQPSGANYHGRPRRRGHRCCAACRPALAARRQAPRRVSSACSRRWPAPASNCARGR